MSLKKFYLTLPFILLFSINSYAQDCTKGQTVTFAQLPTTAIAGTACTVTNVTPVCTNVGSVISSGGGTNTCILTWNGSNWIIATQAPWSAASNPSQTFTGAYALLQLPSPSGVTVTHTGVGGSTTYCYKVGTTDISNGTTLPCGVPGTSPAAQVCGTAEICDTTGNASLSTTPEIITWNSVVGAFGYNVYGRSTGAELLMTSSPITSTTFTDNGSITPNGTTPLINATGQLPGAIDFGGTRGIGSLTTNAWNNVGTASIGVVNQNMKPRAGTYSLMVFCIAYVNNGAASANTFNIRITIDGSDQIEEDGITIGATPARVPAYLQGNIIYTAGANPPAPSAVCQIFAPTGSTLSIAGDPGGGTSAGGPSTQIIGFLMPFFEE